jgi:glycosyltransferase involved in cell wall biosynthesis
MKIVYIAYGLLTPNRAHNLQTVATIDALVQRGVKITFINPEPVVAGQADLNLPSCKTVLLPAGSCFALHKRLTTKGRFWSLFIDRSVYALRALLHVRSSAADAVLTRDIVVCFWLAATRLLTGVPVLYELHTLEQVMFDAEDVICDEIARRIQSATASDFAGYQDDSSWPGRLFKRFIRRVENYALRKARLVMALTTVMALRLKYEFGVEKVRVIPSGHGLQTLQGMHRGEARRQLGLPADRGIAIYCGLTFHGKGMELVFKVAQYLSADCMIIVVGDRPETSARLTALSRELGLQSNLLFVPGVPHKQVSTYLRSADAGLLLYPRSHYLSEFSSPLKVFEYLACGLPVIATSLPALAEVVKDGINGRLVDPEDPQAIAAVIVETLRHTEMLERLGSAARECSTDYHYSRRAERIEEAIIDSLSTQIVTGDTPCIST